MINKNSIALATSVFISSACSSVPKTVTVPDNTVKTAPKAVSEQVSGDVSKSIQEASESQQSPNSNKSSNDYPFGRIVGLESIDTGEGRATQAKLRHAEKSPKRFIENPLRDCIEAFRQGGFSINSYQRFINPQHVNSLPGGTQKEVSQFRDRLMHLPNSGYGFVLKDQFKTKEDIVKFMSIAEQQNCYVAFVRPDNSSTQASDYYKVNIYCKNDIQKFQ